MKKRKKAFDCVEFQHTAGRAVAKRMEGMTAEEKVAYHAKVGEEFRRRQAEMRREAGISGPSESISLRGDGYRGNGPTDTRPIRVYADTSVFGGAFDDEFARGSRRFLEAVREGRIQLVISRTVIDELVEAPEQVRVLFDECLADAEVVEVSDAAVALQAEYLAHGVVSEQWAVDALHVAVATVAGCTAIVSWNFRHIVNFRRVPLYNAVNRISGYGEIIICSPSEVQWDDEPEEDI